jgi:hypothetical protein
MALGSEANARARRAAEVGRIITKEDNPITEESLADFL